MKFHVKFTSHGTENREKALQLWRQGALKAEASVKSEGFWISIGSGVGFAILETTDDKALYELGVTWSDFGELEFTPVIEGKKI